MAGPVEAEIPWENALNLLRKLTFSCYVGKESNKPPADSMTEEPHNLILDQLRAIRGSQERMEHDIKDVKFRVGQVEQTLVHHSSRFDRIEDRLEHIEKRLGLVEA